MDKRVGAKQSNPLSGSEKRTNAGMQTEFEKEEKRAEGKPISPLKKYLYQGITAFLVVACCILFFFAIFRLDSIWGTVKRIFGILQPIVYGLVIAYLIHPIVKFCEKRLIRLFGKRFKNEGRIKKASRIIGIIFAIVIVVFLLVVLGQMVIPELAGSIAAMMRDLPDQIESFVGWITGLIQEDTETARTISEVFEKISDYLENLFQTSNILSYLNNIAAVLTNSVVGIFNIIYNLLIGIIVSVYVLLSKEVFTGQAKKMMYAAFPTRRANKILETVRESDRIFGGFISGKLVDSLIIGVLCFIVCSLLKMPYTLLVSVIVGVTNVIPFFGPYIGAVPSAFLILMADFKMGIIFIIFIILLQQLDGNVIGPKILGQSTGLSAFWVVFSILLGGGLFGIVGMLIGVPTFAVIYHIVKSIVEERLAGKGLPGKSEEYTRVRLIEEPDRRLYFEEDSGNVKGRKLPGKRTGKAGEKEGSGNKNQ